MVINDFLSVVEIQAALKASVLCKSRKGSFQTLASLAFLNSHTFKI